MPRWVAEGGLVGVQQVEEGARADDSDAGVGVEELQLPITGDEVVCVALHGGGEDQVVLGVRGNEGCFGGHGNPSGSRA